MICLMYILSLKKLEKYYLLYDHLLKWLLKARDI